VTNSIRLVDGSDELWLRTAIPNTVDPFVARGHQMNMAPPRVVTIPLIGRSGDDDLTEFSAGAVFQANLWIRDRAGYTRHQHLDRLRAFIQPSRRPYLQIYRDGWLTERRAPVRGADLTVPIDNKSAARLEISIQLVIPAGVLESTIESTATIRPAQTSAGLTLPVTLPASFVPGNVGALANITVGSGEYGAARTPLLIRLYGSCTDPTFTNQTAGRVLELDGLTLAAGQYLEIDFDQHTILLNGDPSLNYYNKLNLSTSEWWQLEPGVNQITVGAATLDASCEADLFWRDRYAI
jgi:hypothetical protein